MQVNTHDSVRDWTFLALCSTLCLTLYLTKFGFALDKVLDKVLEKVLDFGPVTCKDMS